MKIFHNKRVAGNRDIQATPVEIAQDANGNPEKLKIDLAYRIGSLVIVAGWRTGNIGVQLCTPTTALDYREIAVPRPDVSAHLNLTTDEGIGFVLVVEQNGPETIMLAWQTREGHRDMSAAIRFQTEPAISPADYGALGPALGLLALSVPMQSPEWINLISKAPAVSTPCRTASGYIESGSICGLTKTGVVVGWVVHTKGSVVWLEDDAGNIFSLEGAFRRFRQDVNDAVAHQFGSASRDAGFIAHLKGLKPGSKLRLKTVSESGVHLLSEIQCGAMPLDPVAAARWLFSLYTPQSEFSRRASIIDEQVLDPLIRHRLEMWDGLPVHTKQLGAAVGNPRVSVVVPLYGRVDFVEHQLIEFAADPWFSRNCELIYVLDDPTLVEDFVVQAEILHRLYQLPFRWVWGSVNRGFSGANNLGAQHARGKYLVFLNSDAFPQQPGWVEALVQVLAERPDIGAVGPRLVFADGSIQHAGMEFLRRDELGVWVNHHPYMGLDPDLDPHRELAMVPSVTGACLAMRRTDFNDVDRWDTGYLIGDFEDSDLCMKLRSKGLQIAYLPTVQLTHLERQSFKLLGLDDFRMRVVIYNAVRHQNRWGKLIAGGSQPEAVVT